LQDGDVELRLEANSYAFPGWDGKVEVTAVLEAHGERQSNSVQLRVAPFILSSAVQPARRIYVRDLPGKNEGLIRSLKALTSELGVELKILGPSAYPEWEMWLQDIMEVGYSKPPQHGHPVVLKANRGRPLDDMPEKEMLGPDHGWFKFGDYRPEFARGRGGDGWLDWYGNLEVTPPLPGKPFGRVLYGYNKSSGNSLNPQIVGMLEAQGAQTPLIKIHTGWLMIKHVDEIFNFIPAQGGKAFKVLVPDVRVTYRLLDQWSSEGKGSLPIFKDLRKNETLQAFVKDNKLRDFNFNLQKEDIESSIASLKTAIDLDENDVIRIPALFEPVEGYAPALMPNLVNSVYMNGHMLMADPRGPLDAGKDLIQEYVKGLLDREGVEVHFVDDLAYHNRGGNVHCATNVTYSFGHAE
jgi:protein-arginine deiminase